MAGCVHRSGLPIGGQGRQGGLVLQRLRGGGGSPSVAGRAGGWAGSRENLSSGSFCGPMYCLRQTRPRIHERKLVIIITESGGERCGQAAVSAVAAGG
jgi:hypothetical protein